MKKDNTPFRSLREFFVLQISIIRHAHLMLIFPDSTTVQPSKVRLKYKLPICLRNLSIRNIVEKFSFDLESELLSFVRNRDAFPHLDTLKLDKKGILNKRSISEDPYHTLKAECKAGGIHLRLILNEDLRLLRELLSLIYENLA